MFVVILISINIFFNDRGNTYELNYIIGGLQPLTEGNRLEPKKYSSSPISKPKRQFIEANRTVRNTDSHDTTSTTATNSSDDDNDIHEQEIEV